MTQSLALAKRPHVVIATPGRCADHLTSTDTFNLHRIKYLVLDEADRLLEDTFATDLEVIFSHVAEKRQTLLFSATLNDTIDELRQITATDPFCYSVQDKYVQLTNICTAMLETVYNFPQRNISWQFMLIHFYSIGLQQLLN